MKKSISPMWCKCFIKDRKMSWLLSPLWSERVWTIRNLIEMAMTSEMTSVDESSESCSKESFWTLSSLLLPGSQREHYRVHGGNKSRSGLRLLRLPASGNKSSNRKVIADERQKRGEEKGVYWDAKVCECTGAGVTDTRKTIILFGRMYPVNFTVGRERERESKE